MALGVCAPAASAGESLLFDGDDVVTASLPPGLDVGPDTLTITAWIDVDVADKPPGPDGRYVILGHCGSAGETEPWAFVLRSNGSIAFSWEDAPGLWREAPIGSSGSSLLGGWTFVAVTVDRPADTVIPLWDTVPGPIGDKNPAPHAMSTATIVAAPDFVAGCSGSGASLVFGSGFVGGLDDVSLWDTVLAAPDVYDLSTAPFSCASPGLVGFWSFDGADSGADSGPFGLDANFGSGAAGSSPSTVPSSFWGPTPAEDCGTSPCDLDCASLARSANYGISAFEVVSSGQRAASSSFVSEASLNVPHVAGESASVNYRSRDGVVWMGLGSQGASSPAIIAVLPSAGDKDGGDLVRIVGSGFDPGGAATVSFGGAPGAGVSVLSSTAVDVVTPDGTDSNGNPIGAVDVSIAGAFGAATLSDGFSYLPYLYQAEPAVVGGDYELGLQTKPDRIAVFLYGFENPFDFGLPFAPYQGALDLEFTSWQVAEPVSPVIGSGGHLSLGPITAGLVDLPVFFQALAFAPFAPSESEFSNVVSIIAQP